MKLETLKVALQKISGPQHWTKGSFAKAADGRVVPVGHPDACCWCPVGAVMAVAENSHSLR